MSLTKWLQKQVDQLEREIAASPVFESTTPVTREQLEHLTKLVVIHRFLEQELARRSNVSTQEIRFPAAATIPTAPQAYCA